MPKAATIDDEMPRRRGASKAGTRTKPAAKAKAERGFVMRMLLRSPKDTVAGFLALAAIVAILVNALFLQAGQHPSPMFGGTDVITAPVAAAATGRSRAPVYEAIAQLEAAGVLVPLSQSRRNRSWEAAGLLDLVAGLEAGRMPD